MSGSSNHDNANRFLQIKWRTHSSVICITSTAKIHLNYIPKYQHYIPINWVLRRSRLLPLTHPAGQSRAVFSFVPVSSWHRASWPWRGGSVVVFGGGFFRWPAASRSFRQAAFPRSVRRGRGVPSSGYRPATVFSGSCVAGWPGFLLVIRVNSCLE